METVETSHHFPASSDVFLGSLRYMAWWKAHQKPLRNSWRRRALAAIELQRMGDILFVFFWGGGFWVEVLLGKGDVYVKLDTFFVVIESLSMIVCWFSFFVLGKFVDDAMAVFLVRCTAWHTSKPCLHVHVAWLPCKQKSRQPLRDTGCCGVQKPYIEFCFALLSWSWKLLGRF